MINEFTQLIEHYSLKDATKAEKYIKLMKEMIAKFYEAESQPENRPKKIEMQKE